MKKWILWTALATILLAILVHIALVSYIPYKAMDTVMNVRFKDLPRNTLIPSPPTTEQSRNVVRPSPDILYSICMYDVSQKPLLFTCTLPEGYWSASFYADNTDNFYVINDRQAKSKMVEILLVGKNTPVPDAGGAIVVKAQGDKGLALIRMIVPDERSLPGLLELQIKASCRQVD
jgi:uncharacterized membrane protein